MPKTKDELPSDLDPDELNEMIADLAVEMGCPYGVNPDLVELGEIPVGTNGLNHGCMREGKPWDGVTLYREGQRWRRKLIAELKARPEWVAEWRAAREMDRRVKQLCEQKGLQFAPWECPPWWVRASDVPPEPDSNQLWNATVPLAIRLRRQLEAEIRGERS